MGSNKNIEKLVDDYLISKGLTKESLNRLDSSFSVYSRNYEYLKLFLFPPEISKLLNKGEDPYRLGIYQYSSKRPKLNEEEDFSKLSLDPGMILYSENFVDFDKLNIRSLNFNADSLTELVNLYESDFYVDVNYIYRIGACRYITGPILELEVLSNKEMFFRTFSDDVPEITLLSNAIPGLDYRIKSIIVNYKRVIV